MPVARSLLWAADHTVVILIIMNEKNQCKFTTVFFFPFNVSWICSHLHQMDIDIKVLCSKSRKVTCWVFRLNTTFLGLFQVIIFVKFATRFLNACRIFVDRIFGLHCLEQLIAFIFWRKHTEFELDGRSYVNNLSCQKNC